MSRELAKSPYLRAVNDPDKGYIVPADAQQSVDVIYNDMEQVDQDTLRLSSGGIVSGPIDVRGGLYIRSGSPNTGYVLASDANGGTYWTQPQAGPKGDQGDQGPVGPQGMTGPQGPPGQQGATGSTGAQGPQGAAGEQGPQGSIGATGHGLELKGTVPSVDSPPSGMLAGEAYLVEATNDVWIWNGTSWHNSGPLTGPAGPEGPQGIQGPAGEQGPQGAPGPQGATGPLYGGSGANTAKWRAALQRVRASATGRARIVCIGTSNTFGWGPSNPDTMNWPELMRQNLENRLGVKTAWGPETINKFSVDGVDPGVAHERPWFTKGSWNVAPYAYWGDQGGFEGEPGQTTGPTFTMSVRDGFSFLYIDRTAGRTFQYKVDGGTATTITTTGSNLTKEVRVPVGAAGTHTLTLLNPTGGTAIVPAIGADVNNGITVCNWGVPGGLIGALHRDQGQYWSGLEVLKGAAPDLVVLEVGANDVGTTTAASYKTSLETIIDFIQANTAASVILCETYATDQVAGAPFVTAAREVAVAKGVDLVSLMDVMQGSRDPWRAPGDPDHMTREGQELWAQAFTEIVLGTTPRQLLT